MIDLGLLGVEAPPAVEARRRPAARPSRPLLVLAALALTLLGLAGGQSPGAAGLSALTTVPALAGSQFAILDGVLYVAEAAPGGNRITAYRPRDGRPLWSTPVTVLASLVGFHSSGGVLLASMAAPGVSGDQTVALDQRTGAVLWHSADILAAVVPSDERALLASLYRTFGGPRMDTLVASDRLGFRVAAVGLRDGRTAWTYALGPGCRYAVDADPGARARIAALCSGPATATGPDAGKATAGELRTLDLATGREERNTAVTLPVVGAPDPLPGPAPGSTAPFGPVLSVVGGRVLVGVPHTVGAELTAYDPETLRPLWTHRLAGNDYGVTPCAGALCLSDSSGLTVVDPGTGAMRWQTAERAYTEPPGLPAGWLLVEPLAGAGAMLVDVGTGGPVLDLSGWGAVNGEPGGAPVFARWHRPPDGRVWFATVAGDVGGARFGQSPAPAALPRAHPPSVRLIGSASDVLQDACRADGPYLVCQTLDRGLRLWRYWR